MMQKLLTFALIALAVFIMLDTGLVDGVWP